MSCDMQLFLPSLQAVTPVLDNPNEPVSDLSYFDCLDLVMEKSRVNIMYVLLMLLISRICCSYYSLNITYMLLILLP